jgi:hypothetical protein
METSKQLFAAIAAAGIMSTSQLSLAQPGPGNCDGAAGMPCNSVRVGKFDPAVRVDQRLAQFKAELKVTAEQEPLWQAFAEKAKAEAVEGFTAIREQMPAATASAPERMARMIDMMKRRTAALEATADVFKRLYDVLSPEQQKIADAHAARMASKAPMGHRGRMAPPRQGMPGEPGRS